MASVKLNWVLPVNRESGKPLKIEDIKSVEIQMSADLGANYVTLESFTSDVLETVVQDLEPGDWYFRGLVHDIQGRVSKPVVSNIILADNTPPGALQTLTLSLV